MMRKRIFQSAFFLLWLAGCVGVDYIADPVVVSPARVAIQQETAAIQAGESFQFRAEYYDSLGMADQTASFSWSCSDTNIAAIDQSGLALGKSVGQVMIYASANGVTSESARLTVVADPTQVATVAITPANATLGVGDSQQFSATAQNLNGEPVAGRTFSWRSTNTAVATVDDAGLVTAVTPGNTTVIATTDGVESSPVPVEVMGQNRTGTFTRRPGTTYSVQGTAILEQGQDGRLTLRFGDDFSCSNGPGLEVFLSPSNTVNSASLNLGALQSTSGEQSYEVPESVQLATYDWVIIHCVPFNVTFGYAEFEEAGE